MDSAAESCRLALDGTDHDHSLVPHSSPLSPENAGRLGRGIAARYERTGRFSAHPALASQLHDAPGPPVISTSLSLALKLALKQASNNFFKNFLTIITL